MSKRRWDIVAVVLVGVMSTSWLAFKLYQTEQQSLERDFDYFAANQARLIKWRIDSSLSVLNYLSTLYQGSDEVTEQEFAMVADGILARHREIKALEWIPRVKASERGAFEAAMQQRYPAFTFTDKVQGQPVAAGQRERYYPVYYVRPFSGNERRFGMDMSRQPEVTDAFELAMNSANPALTAVNLDVDLGKVVMAVVPIYHSLPLTVASREKLLKGYLLGVFQVEEMLHDLVLDGHRAHLEYQIWDDSGDNSILLLGAEPHPTVAGERSKRFVYADLAGRQWRLEALANPAFFSSKRSLTPYLVGIGGALAALASGVFMWQMRRRNREVEELVRARTEELNRVNQQLTRQSLTDGLTQVANRRQFDNWLSQEWESARRTSKPITLFVIDVDLFKSYNDRYGHLAGDRVLKKIARMLASQLNRPRDLLARYGGEEFAAVLPETGRKAVKFADSLRAMVEALGIPHEGSDIGSYVTISIGVATLVPEVDQTPEQFFELADKALYKAKSQGRNRIAYHNEQHGDLMLG